MDRLNNIVELAGKIASNPSFSHELFGEKFYLFNVSVLRLSQNVDTVPVMITERFGDIDKYHVGQTVRIEGRYRSFNRFDGKRNRLLLSVFAQKVETNELPNESQNEIYLDGYICKGPIFRETPYGRQVADVMLAVNRAYGKIDYIPCIAWERNAKLISKLKTGAHIRTYGRIQSREYVKKYSETHAEMRIAYEVSISKIEVVNDEKE